MTKQTVEIIRRALQQYRGDDLERASVAFRGLSPKEMQTHYGASRRTRQQILDGYQQHVDAVTTALHEVEVLKETR